MRNGMLQQLARAKSTLSFSMASYSPLRQALLQYAPNPCYHCKYLSFKLCLLQYSCMPRRIRHRYMWSDLVKHYIHPEHSPLVCLKVRATGWSPHHLVVREEGSDAVLGCCPTYMKVWLVRGCMSARMKQMAHIKMGCPITCQRILEWVNWQ